MDRTTGQVLSADAVRARHHHRSASTCRPARCKYNPQKDPRAGETRAQHLPGVAGRARTGSRRPARRARGCSTSRTRTCARTRRPTQASYIAGTPYVGADVKMYAGPGGHRGVFTAWDPVARAQGLGDRGELPGLERRARHRRRRRVLRHHGRLVQGGRRAGAASCCGSSRPAPGSSASRSPTAAPTASSTSPCWRASAAGPARSCRATSIRATATAALGFVNAMKDLPQATQAGGMLYVFALPGAGAVKRGTLLLALAALAWLPAARRAPTPHAPTCCASAPTPTTCRTRAPTAAASRTASRSCWRSDLGVDAAVRVAAATGAASCARPWAPACATWSSACRSATRARADHRALLPLQLRVRAARRRRRRRRRGFDDPRLRAAAHRRAADRRRHRRHAARLRAGAAPARPPTSSASRSPATSPRRSAWSRRIAARRARRGLVWGPQAGYFAQRATVPLRVHARRRRRPTCRTRSPSSSRSRWACAAATTALRERLRRRRCERRRADIDAHAGRLRRAARARRGADDRPLCRRCCSLLLRARRLRARDALASAPRRPMPRLRLRRRARARTSLPSRRAAACGSRPATAAPTKRTPTPCRRASGCSAGTTATAATPTAAAASGPALMDDEWLYGSEPAQHLRRRIVQGRPNGMPSFGGHIPEDQVWQIVAYVRSMSGQLRKDVAPIAHRHAVARASPRTRAARTPGPARRRAAAGVAAMKRAGSLLPRRRMRRAGAARHAAPRADALDPVGPQAAHIVRPVARVHLASAPSCSG